MKVEIRNQAIKPFEKIKQGEVFVILGETMPFMKIETLEYDGTDIVNAVDLTCGDTTYFPDDKNVVVTDATLTIGRI